MKIIFFFFFAASGFTFTRSFNIHRNLHTTTSKTTTTTTTTATTKSLLYLLRSNNNDFDDDYDEYDNKRPPRKQNITQNPSFFDGIRLPKQLTKALVAGVFVIGVATGVTVDSAINTNPKDLASRDAIDRQAPNPKVCTNYGSSAMAFDQRVFVSFNPFNVYVAQADVKPACVLRQSNVVPVLMQDKQLINEKEVRGCKANMNTWAFVGDLNDKPQLSCVYKSEDAQNEFLSNPKVGIGEDVYDDENNIKAVDVSTRKEVKRVRNKSQTDGRINKQPLFSTGKNY